MKIRLILAIASVIILGGCGAMGRAKVGVDALAAPDAAAYTKYVLIRGPGILAGLEYDNYASQVVSELSKNGLQAVSNNSEADFAVVLGYGIDSPLEKSQNYSIPRYGVTGYSGATTTASTYGGQTTASTSFTPTYGITGHTSGVNKYTVHPLYIMLFAWEKSNNGTSPARQLWQVTITAESLERDLRAAFPAMLRAAVSYIGKTTQGIQSVWVEKNPPPK